MTNLRIGLSQLALEKGKPQDNLVTVKSSLMQAASQGMELVLQPELWASGYDLKNVRRYAQPRSGGFFQELKTSAEELGIWVGGSLLEEDQGVYYNTHYLYGPDREVHYRKVHLFGLLEEEKYLSPGSHLVVTEVKGVRTGLATCYDLRFPEMFRAYALAGVKLVLLVAEWPEERIDHWWKLLQARAIENQFFLAAVNKTGDHDGIPLGGKSAVINPRGEPIQSGAREVGVITAEIDLAEVDQARRWIPVLEDRNPGAYQDIQVV